MLRISKQSEQALSILAACARSPRSWFQTRDVAVTTGASKDRAAQIVHMLSCRGFLETRRGRHGGIRIGYDAGSMSVGDVIRLTEPGLQRVVDARGTNGILYAAVEGAMASFLRTLDSVSIRDVAVDPVAAIKVASISGAITICPYAFTEDPGRPACHIHH